jgi:eukaryotic-like serine/threonine-protein kinase
MSLQPSTRLGPYEIISSIGAGGMGEVYRARDTRLDRTVAIKVLLEHLSSNPERRERLELEAKAISSLSHPHICSLFDVGHQEGIDFLVMEYLEGETLAHRLKKGPLPPEQVLRYAIQIIDALDTAHRHGVIHRDLKPGNIMLTKTGAKLLDFGLAKMRAAEAAVGMTQLPTETTPLTREGTILGTLQYMAPEQLEGKEADQRTDIFAFGAVLYEMATGRKAFEGKSQASVIAAILEREPPPISTVQAMTPLALDHVIRACLIKEPEARWQNAHDVLLQLKRVAELDSQAGSRVSPWKPSGLLVWGLVALLAVVAASVTLAYFREQPGQAHAIRFQVPAPETIKLGEFDAPVVSPDGLRLALAGESSEGHRGVWIHSLDSLSDQLLPGTEGAFSPFWSADSRFLAFFAGQKLRKIQVTGGPPQTLCDSDAAFGGGAWSQDGIILFVRSGNVHRISMAGGEVKPVLQLDKSRNEIFQSSPQFLPDGRHFLYASHSSDASKSGIYVGSLDSREGRLLTPASSNVSYAPPGFLIYGSEETLLAHAFNAKTVRFTGEPFPIADHVIRTDLPRSLFSVSDTGILAYRSGTSKVQLAWYGRDGKRLAAVSEAGVYGQIALSPDEKRLAVGRPNPQTNTTDLWILELSDGILSRFTFDPGDDDDPVWSPNGRELAFSSRRKGNYDLYRKQLGGDDEVLLLQSGKANYAEVWLPDGSLVFNQNTTGIYQLPLSGERKPVPLLETDFQKTSSRVSSDGHRVAYSSTESGRWEVYVAAFPSFTEKRQVSRGGGCQAMWRKDGKELFYLSTSGKLMSIRVKGGGFETGIPTVLFQTRLRVLPMRAQYAISGDGQRFIFGEPTEQTVEPINVVLNWTAGMKH